MTVPEDSTGVAHILEHSVLMGSKKYPVKDVFGEIHKGGLMTFLNAMTGADTTWYPFATRNLTEFQHHGRLLRRRVQPAAAQVDPSSRSGWHYHQEHEDDPLQFTGVVFNEMKGAYSDPIRAPFHHTYQGLLPGSTYAHESGGDPHRIPDLSYEQFVAFHRSHYHPANATFSSTATRRWKRNWPLSRSASWPPAPRRSPRAGWSAEGEPITRPVLIEESYPVQPGSPTAERTFIALSTLVGTARDRKLNAAFQIIANILFNWTARRSRRPLSTPTCARISAACSWPTPATGRCSSPT